jgi:hypothetical protein
VVWVRADVPPVVAVTITLLVPAGVPGLLGLLLPPPQAGIHKVESANTATRLNKRAPRNPRLRFPVVISSPKTPGSSMA